MLWETDTLFHQPAYGEHKRPYKALQLLLVM